MINCAIFYVDKAGCDCANKQVNIQVGPQGVKISCVTCGVADSTPWDKLPMQSVVDPSMNEKVKIAQVIQRMDASETVAESDENAKNPLLDSLRNFFDK